MFIKFRAGLLSIALMGQVLLCLLVAALPARADSGIIAGGGTFSTALKSDGTVWAWGYNYYGGLGNGTLESLFPVQASGLTGMAAIEAGKQHFLALKSDGTVWAWGSNYLGKLGDGTDTHRYSPVQLSGLSSVAAIAAGWDHSLALKADGTVWAWGSNYDGQLGDGTSGNGSYALSPMQVPGLSGVTAIAAGTRYSVALKSDGTVWAWGYNDFGQLGDGTTNLRSSPVQVPGLSGVTAISALGYFTVALKSDGTVWAWGHNAEGRLGDGTTTFRYSPVQVLGLSGVAAIAAGWDHSLALKNDGTAWAWGSNSHGELGLGDGIATPPWHTSPVQVSGLSGVAVIAAGHEFSLAVKNDGTVWAWGRNVNGQLGDGTTTHSSAPLQVLGSDGVGYLNLGDAGSPPPPSDDHGNSTETATVINADSSTAGSLEVGGDVDYFKLEITSDTTVTLQSTGSTDTYGKLLDVASTVLAENDDGGAGSNFLITMPLPAGTYYVVVKGGTTTVTGNYTLVSESTGGSTPPPPPSDDHGDNIETATVISANSSTAGALEVGGDVDYFKLVISSGATVTLQSTGSTDTYGTLLDASATVLAQNDDGGAGTNFLITAELPAGTYYVVVRGYNGSTTGNYTLVAESESTGGGDHGDSTETATVISANSSTAGALEVGGDYDYFKLELASPATVTLQSTGSTDTYGVLADAALNILAEDDDGGAGTNFLITAELPAGTYYVVVLGYSTSTTGDYTLVAESSGGGTPSDDHGDNIETATVISANSSTAGVLEVGGDYDYFKLELASPATVTLQSTGSTDTYGVLADATLNILAEDDDGGAGTNFLITASLSPGTYYVVVLGYSALTTGDYTLSASASQDVSPSTLAAASLPSSRSVQVGNAATAFATVINTGGTTATGCSIAPVTSVPASFYYQTTNPATNALTGSQDTPVDIAAGAFQTFIYAFTPTSAFSPTEVELSYDCTNTQPAGTTLGVNTLLLSGSATPVPDIVALAASSTGDGIVNIPGTTGANAFAVATVNVGAGDSITASADTGSASLPVTLFICETNPSTGACLAPPAASVTTTIAGGATPTFAIFVNGSGTVPFDPANNRIFVRFKDDSDLTRGATSVAVRTQ